MSKIQNNIILSTENIHASYGKKEILKGASIKITKGQIVCFIGPNGAGKSTLLKTLMGLLLPKQGSIYFEDEEITNLATYERSHRGIGYLFQGGAIFTNLTILENLRLSLVNLKDNTNDNIENIFIFFNELEERKHERAGLLSGGLKQMLSLAMILIRKPKVLLLDEPSAGLAPALVKTLLKKIKEINNNENTTILLVEQNIRQALDIAHFAYVMKGGEIVKSETNLSNLLYNEKVFL
ncbi:ABC transporter ATP-binding protein [Thermodesulfobacteriota bacterium]